MPLHWLILLATIGVGGLSTYTTSIELRGQHVMQPSPARRVLSGASFLASIAAFAWGVINLTWWIVALAAGGVLIFDRTIYGGEFHSWHVVQPVLDVACIAGALVLWFVI